MSNLALRIAGALMALDPAGVRVYSSTEYDGYAERIAEACSKISVYDFQEFTDFAIKLTSVVMKSVRAEFGYDRDDGYGDKFLEESVKIIVAIAS